MTDATWQPVLIRGADLIVAWLPHAEDVTVAGADHSLALTHPGQVATALADFLERHPIAGSGQRRDRDTTLLPKGEGRGCMATGATARRGPRQRRALWPLFGSRPRNQADTLGVKFPTAVPRKSRKTARNQASRTNDTSFDATMMLRDGRIRRT